MQRSLVSLNAPIAVLPQLGFVASLAVYDLAASAVGSGNALSLKWPNDVLLDERKLSGILAETIHLSPDRCAVAIGCGVNLQHAPPDTRYGATSLAAHGFDVTPADAGQRLFAAMSKWMGTWNLGGGFDDINREWSARSRQIGTHISLDLGGELISGMFSALAPDGALVLEGKDGTRRTVRAGDVLQSSSPGLEG